MNNLEEAFNIIMEKGADEGVKFIIANGGENLNSVVALGAMYLCIMAEFNMSAEQVWSAAENINYINALAEVLEDAAKSNREDFMGFN